MAARTPSAAAAAAAATAPTGMFPRQATAGLRGPANACHGPPLTRTLPAGPGVSPSTKTTSGAADGRDEPPGSKSAV